MPSLWVSAELPGEEVAVGKDAQHLWWVRLEKEEQLCSCCSWLPLTWLPVHLGTCSWYQCGRGTVMAPKEPQAQWRPFPTTLFKMKSEEGLLQYCSFAFNLLSPWGLELPDYGPFCLSSAKVLWTVQQGWMVLGVRLHQMLGLPELEKGFFLQYMSMCVLMLGPCSIKDKKRS